MRFLFIVQGEGRGHLTQAITFEEMLRRNGHEVVEVLVGKSSSRTLPGFFNRTIQAPVKRFLSPNFLPTADNKRVNLTKSLIYNLIRLPEYIRSMRYINQRIRETEADVVINFYELLTGLTYLLFRPSVPYVCIGHQYLFLHRDFDFPNKSAIQLRMLRLFTEMTAFRSVKKLALSFYEMPSDEARRVVVVPPLIRREVKSMQTEVQEYIHGYMVNSGFADSVQAFHEKHPEVPLKFFWDKSEVDEQVDIDDTLSFHQIDDVKFLNAMASCKAYASTGGFESICEAMYLGKPVLMVPAHIEQDCNAYDAMKAGAGIVSDSFDLESLIRFAATYSPDRHFTVWVNRCEQRMIGELETLAVQSSSPSITSIPSLTNYLSI